MLLMSKTWTFSMWKNVCCCLVLHRLRIGPESPSLDHSPCANMIWILATCLICDGVRVHVIVINNKSVRALFEQTRWLFINNSPCSYFHQFIRFPLLRRPSFIIVPFWVFNLLSKRPKQVSLFFDAAHSTSSEVVDFHIWLSPGFLML